MRSHAEGSRKHLEEVLDRLFVVGIYLGMNADLKAVGLNAIKDGSLMGRKDGRSGRVISQQLEGVLQDEVFGPVNVDGDAECHAAEVN